MKRIKKQDDRGVVFYWEHMCISDIPSARKSRQRCLSVGQANILSPATRLRIDKCRITGALDCTGMKSNKRPRKSMKNAVCWDVKSCSLVHVLRILAAYYHQYYVTYPASLIRTETVLFKAIRTSDHKRKLVFNSVQIRFIACTLSEIC
jgi:hypothetical protein